tara:strand:- start:146 stop:898 length:753 start_codon:yes stop_codon:yes gene_type:complete
MRKRLFQILEIAHHDDKVSHRFDVFIISLIILNIFALVLSTVPEINDKYKNVFEVFEVISVSIFTLEYLGRIYSCVEDNNYSDPILGRLRFIYKPIILIDLLAILPFYISALEIDLRVLRMLRFGKLFRLLKLFRYIKALDRISVAMIDRAQEISISLAMIGGLILASATLMYFAEHDAQPDVFRSIPAAMWWAVATLTTVGYGDAYPITAVGKFLGSIIAILGIAAIALPTAILSEAFSAIKKNDNLDT